MAAKLIDFWAEWCPPCKAMSAVIAEIAEDFEEDLEIVKINVDEDKEKADKYEIFSIPTFVLEKDGKEMARTSGARSKEEFAKWIEEHL